jgi:probable rRNA maturation factor
VKQPACVHIISNQRAFKIDRKKIAAIAGEICRRLGVAHYEVCLQFVTPQAMQSLNKHYREKDTSTDVLSFPQYTWKRPLKFQKDPPDPRPIVNPLPLGDVVISARDASENVNNVQDKLPREICFLLVHGILHLVGHDHMKPSEKKRMFSEQAKLMRVFAGTKKKAPLWDGCIKKVSTQGTSKKSGTMSKPGKVTSKRSKRKKR